MNWILASGSPRRRELLEMLGVPDLTIRPATGPERATPGAGPEQTVRELSLHKAQEVAQTCAPEDIIIAADTIVYLDGAILGKPKDHDDAVRMLTALSGREHIVYTGVAVLRGGELRQAGADGREIERLADHARGRDDDVLRRDVQRGCCERAHLLGDGGAVGVAGVGVAAVHNDGLCIAVLQVLTVHRDGCAVDLVGGIAARARAADVRLDQRQVELGMVMADAAMHARRGKALRRTDAAGN